MSADDHEPQRCHRPAQASAAGRGRFTARGRLRGQADAEAQALARLPDSDIAGALRDLPEELRVAVWLADVEGLRYREIADVLGMPVTAVAARLHRGRRRIRDRLAASAVRRGLAAAPG
jgi:RNA polymerase sigma-70 factor (ECF subfamily)